MKNKIPTTELEIELLCDKIILQQRVTSLQLHLEALQEVLKEKPISQRGYQLSKPSLKNSFRDSL
jgi:hypothetical protein